MKHFYTFLLVVFLLMSFQNVNATTHIWFWVNGDTGNVLTQGDILAWEIDLAAPGNTAEIELYLDLDQSRDVSEGDFFLTSFFLQDGAQDDGPADSSTVPDGLLYVELGP